MVYHPVACLVMVQNGVFFLPQASVSGSILTLSAPPWAAVGSSSLLSPMPIPPFPLIPVGRLDSFLLATIKWPEIVTQLFGQALCFVTQLWTVIHHVLVAHFLCIVLQWSSSTHHMGCPEIALLCVLSRVHNNREESIKRTYCLCLMCRK